MRQDSGSYDEIMRLTSSRKGDGASAYDFRKTEKFTADQIKFIENTFVSFSETVITSLAPMLQSRFRMELMTIVTRSYTSYINSLAETTPMLIFKLEQDVQGFIDAYAQAWKTLKPVKPQLVSFEFNPMAVHIASPSELMVVIPFQADIASANGSINVVLPFQYLRDCLPKGSYDEFNLTRGAKTSASHKPV